MRIGELAGRIGVNPKTVRYYEGIGLLPAPEREPSGYRDYDDQDVDRLRFIRTAQRLGLSLSEISEILAFRRRSERPCGYVLEVLDRQVAEPTDEACYCAVIEHSAATARPRDDAPLTTATRTRAQGHLAPGTP